MSEPTPGRVILAADDDEVRPPGPRALRPAPRPWALIVLALVLGIAAGIALAGAFYIDLRTFFLHPELIGNLESCARMVALVVGGWWAYSRFLRTREAAPHIEVSQSVEHLFLSAEKLLLRVQITVENRGKVLVRLNGLSATVNHVHPLKDSVLAQLLDTQRSRGALRVPWKKLAALELDRPGSWLLEPGEKVRESFDFVLNRRLRAVSVYTFVPVDPDSQGPLGQGDAPERDAGGRRYGWSCRSLYRIEEPGGSAKTAPPADVYAVVDLSRYLPSPRGET